MANHLEGRLILVIEDDPLVAFDIANEFASVGADTLIIRSVEQGLRLVETERPSAAIVDYGLEDGDSSPLCERLTDRRIPFVIYSGYPRAEVGCRAGIYVSKPVYTPALVQTIADLLQHQPPSPQSHEGRHHQS